jgi:hypothetical protein
MAVISGFIHWCARIPRAFDTLRKFNACAAPAAAQARDAAALLEQAKISATTRMGRIVVGPPDAMGAAIVLQRDAG